VRAAEAVGKCERTNSGEARRQFADGSMPRSAIFRESGKLSESIGGGEKWK
jgi:hypothetical protein